MTRLLKLSNKCIKKVMCSEVVAKTLTIVKPRKLKNKILICEKYYVGILQNNIFKKDPIIASLIIYPCTCVQTSYS